MKKISVMIPCYNEEENVREICAAVIDVLEKELSSYDYEILFIDNCSQDKTREYLREMCKKNPKVKAIFNAKNFGQFNSPVYGMCQTTGDCTISLCCDFQDPVELIPVFVKEWEDTGIVDAFYTSDGKGIGTMSDVIQFYHEQVEPAFAELSKLRNKKRAIQHYVRHHQLPDDVRRSLIAKIDRLEHMICTMSAPYKKTRHYYNMLNHEIKQSISVYIKELTPDTMTVLEKLDIREFRKSRRLTPTLTKSISVGITPSGRNWKQC